MRDNNFPCGKCGGSGSVPEVIYEDEPDNAVDEIEHPCPSCNKGNVQLAVKCGTCSEGYVQVMPDGEVDRCPKNCTNGYRPLTSDEVDELERFEYHLWMLKHGKVVGAKWDSFYWNKVDSGEMYFKGSQVTLIPID